MHKQFLTALLLAAVGGLWIPERAAAQDAAPAAQGQSAAAQLPAGVLTKTPCGTPLTAEQIPVMPPAGMTFIWIWQPCFPTQNNETAVDPETYQYYSKVSSPIR